MSASITAQRTQKIFTFSGSAPTAADILLEGKKTLIASMEPADESVAYIAARKSLRRTFAEQPG